VSDRTVLLGQALDAVDPRLSDDQRTESAACALAANPVLAGAVWASLTMSVLARVAEQSAPGAADEIMNALATVILDALPAIPESGDTAW
jgi:hypothetical protein